MSVLGKLALYAKVWTVNGITEFDEEDLAQIKNIVVVNGDWGLSAKIERLEKDSYLSLHRDSSPLNAGDRLDPKACKIVELQRGEEIIHKLLYQSDPL